MCFFVPFMVSSFLLSFPSVCLKFKKSVVSVDSHLEIIPGLSAWIEPSSMKEEMPSDGSKPPSIQYLMKRDIMEFSSGIERLCFIPLACALTNLKRYPPVLVIPILHFHFDNGLPIEGDPPRRFGKALLAVVVHIDQVGVWVLGPLVPGDRLGPHLSIEPVHFFTVHVQDDPLASSHVIPVSLAHNFPCCPVKEYYLFIGWLINKKLLFAH